MAQTAKPGAEKALDNAKDITENVAEQAVGVAREVAHQSAEGTAELGRVLVDLTVAQTRQNLETLQALTGAVDWERVAKAVDWDRLFQVQSEFLRVSFERIARLTQSYLEVSQAVVTAAADVAQDQALKAA